MKKPETTLTPEAMALAVTIALPRYREARKQAAATVSDTPEWDAAQAELRAAIPAAEAATRYLEPLATAYLALLAENAQLREQVATLEKVNAELRELAGEVLNAPDWVIESRRKDDLDELMARLNRIMPPPTAAAGEGSADA